MEKVEAIKLMREGEKITHTCFSEDEWMTITSTGQLLLEDGVECSLDEYFRFRIAGIWDDGYSLFN